MTLRLVFTFAACAVASATVDTTRAYFPPWEEVPGTSAPRAMQQAIIPLLDGRALVVGGNDGNTFDVFDPVSEQWEGSGNLLAGRTDAVVARLLDGRVLVAAGFGGADGDSVVFTAEIIDPATLTSSWTTSPPFGLTFASAVTLDDGRVLVVGGQALPTSGPSFYNHTLLYDPDTAVWTTGPTLAVDRAQAVTTKLDDGRVLIASGVGDQVQTEVAEIFVPGSDTTPDAVVLAAPMPLGRIYGTSGRLADGRVIFAGGVGAETGQFIADATANIYDPVSDKWHVTPPMNHGRIWAAGATLPDGSFLIAGGLGTWLTGDPPALSQVERYDPMSDTWELLDPLPAPRFAAAAATLGDVLLLQGGLLDLQTFHATSLMLSFKNEAPVAVAAASTTTALGVGGSTVAVTVSGAGSSDSDDGDVLTYTWSLGATVLAVTTDPETDTMIGLPVGSSTVTHTVTLTVTDRYGETDQDTVEVTVLNAVEALQADLDACDAHLDGVEADLGTCNSGKASLQSQLDTCDTDKAALKVQLDTANTEKAALKVQLDTANADKAALQAQLDTANADKAALQAQLDTANAEKAALEVQLDAANADKAALQAQLDVAKADKAALQAQLDTALANLAGVEAERDTCLDDNAELAAEVAELQALVDELMSGGQGAAAYVVERLQALIRAAIPAPTFVVPGASYAEKLERLLLAIEALPRGAHQILYNELRRNR